MQIMIDIETLSSKDNAVIIQIGMCTFRFTDYECVIHRELLFDVETTEQMKIGRDVSNDTVAWWLDTVHPESRQSVMQRKNIIGIQPALQQFNNFVGSAKNSRDTDDEFGLWANPPSFDLHIIRGAMNAYDITPAWTYRSEYDLRTVRKINEHLGLGVEYVKNEMSHNALVDSINQAKFAHEVMKRMKDKK